MLYNSKSFLYSLRLNLEHARDCLTRDLKELRNPDQPAAALAAAFALGTLLSFIPVPLLDTMLVGMVLTRFKQVRRAPLFMARLIWNDFLVFPLYGPAYKIGSAILLSLLGWEVELPGTGTALISLLCFILGALFLAAALALLGYLVFLLGIKLYRVASRLFSETPAFSFLN